MVRPLTQAEREAIANEPTPVLAWVLLAVACIWAAPYLVALFDCAMWFFGHAQIVNWDQAHVEFLVCWTFAPVLVFLILAGMSP